MNSVETRNIARDSLFLMAELRLEGEDRVYQVKVRNLSTGGMMAEGDVQAPRGMLVMVNLRNIGWIEGSVAWVQERRFGIAFRAEIDPKTVRNFPSADQSHEAPRFTRSARPAVPPRPDKIRTI